MLILRSEDGSLRDLQERSALLRAGYCELRPQRLGPPAPCGEGQEVDHGREDHEGDEAEAGGPDRLAEADTCKGGTLEV